MFINQKQTTNQPKYAIKQSKIRKRKNKRSIKVLRKRRGTNVAYYTIYILITYK